MAKTGERAFALLKHLLEQNKKFNKAYKQIPFLIPLSAQYTGATPCKEIYESIPSRLSPTILSADFACGFPPADIYHCGASLLVYGNSQGDVNQCAQRYLDDIIQTEDLFSNQLLSASDAVAYAIKNGNPSAPIIIADVQDNPGAGGSSDTTQLLHALVNQNAQQAVVGCVWDVDAAQQAHAAGLNSTIKLALGGKSGPDGEVPLSASFSVVALSNGQFRCHGEMIGGIDLDLGPMALLKVAKPNTDIRIVVTSERVQCLDQGLFRELGIEPKEESIVIVKSTVHFRADFADVTDNIILAACPGTHPCDLESVPYQRLRTGVRLGPSSTVESG